eukprot:12980725-Alexandrium_andersonii.AAC.1
MVATGGMRTAMTRWHDSHTPSEVRGCPNCGCEVLPTLQHVLWECPFFAGLRTYSCPTSPMAARLGWD